MATSMQLVQRAGGVSIDKIVTQQVANGWTLFGSPFDLQGNAAQVMIKGAGTAPGTPGSYQIVQKDGINTLEKQLGLYTDAGWQVYGTPFDLNGLPAQAIVKGDVPITQGAGAGSGEGGGDIVAADITDATAVGRNVLKAADGPSARTAIGAGTSNLAIGTTAATAKAGNYAPTSAEVSNALKAKTQIAALTALATPASATTEEIATLLNAVVAALKV